MTLEEAYENIGNLINKGYGKCKIIDPITTDGKTVQAGLEVTNFEHLSIDDGILFPNDSSVEDTEKGFIVFGTKDY